VKKYIEVILCGLWLLGGCGGGSMGGSPNATLSMTSLAFGDESVGVTSPAQNITLSNSGTATLSIASIAVAADFEETNTCGSTLVPGAKCTLSVTFSPTTTGSLNGTISIADNATGSPQTVTLNGTGTPRAGRCSMKGESCGPNSGNSCCAGLLCRTRAFQSLCE
jgi:hypothetical protein